MRFFSKLVRRSELAGNRRVVASSWSLTIVGVVIVLGIAALAFATSPVALAQDSSPQFDPTLVPTPASPPLASIGRSIFQQNCAPCHGPEGNGDGPSASGLPNPPFAFADASLTADRTLAEWFFTAKFGRMDKMMPPWQNQLSDDEIWEAVTYAWSLHTSESAVTDGAALYADSCTACHGETGAGDGPEATGSMPDFSDIGYTITRSQNDWIAGWQDAHPDIGADWSADQRQNVLEYVRTFSYSPPWEPPYKPGNGVIRGVGQQGTPGAPDIAGLEVTLDAFAGFDPVATFTSTLDAEGQFQFDGLMVDPNILYLATIGFDGVAYRSPILTLSPDQPEIDTDITVYATTDDDSAIVVDRSHWIIDPQPGALVIGQNLVFGNEGDRTLVGHSVDGVDGPVTVALKVPEGAQEITFQNGTLGQRFKQSGNVIYDTAPVIPGKGTRQIVIRYMIPYSGTEAQIRQEFLYPVRLANLLIPELPGLNIEVSPLEDRGTESIQGDSYHIWQTDNLTGNEITVGFTGLLRPGDPDPRADAASGQVSASPANTARLDSRTAWVLGGFIAVLLAGVLIWASRQTAEQEADPEELLLREQDFLIAEIARLDDLHTLEEIDDAAWQHERSQLKARLLKVAARLAEEQSTNGKVMPETQQEVKST
jgi:mono/diheme cytochrome c family protein